MKVESLKPNPIASLTVESKNFKKETQNLLEAYFKLYTFN
jgi:hypothetical protein